MAVFWVQHYYTLPIIFEDFGMGNELPQGRQPQLTDDTDDTRRGTACMRLPLRHTDLDRTSQSKLAHHSSNEFRAIPRAV
jgi:hypothetical protein